MGSEKQVAWAETIRTAKIKSMAMIVAMAEAVGGEDIDQRSDDERREIRDKVVAIVKSSNEGHIWQMHLSAFMREVKHGERARALLDVISKVTKASWWIDNRDSMPARLALELRSEIDSELARGKHEQPTEESSAMRDALTAALLKPSEDPRSTQIAEISLSSNGRELRVAFAEKHEDFRLLMRGMGFRWADHYWARGLGITTGDPVDRMAETAHRIIGAGFMVRLHDDAAREKAVSGQFETEQTRWVTRAVGGAYDGWCRIQWPKSDDLYEPAKRVLGARYKDGYIYAPPGSIMEVLDFATSYGFSISPGVAAMHAAHLSAIENGAVVCDPKHAPSPIKDNGERQSLSAERVDVDHDLLDTH